MYRQASKISRKHRILPPNSYALNWIAISTCEINCLRTIFSQVTDSKDQRFSFFFQALGGLGKVEVMKSVDRVRAPL
jgi:hypothetical protein